MRKTPVVIGIFVLSAVIATVFVIVQSAVTRATHPLPYGEQVAKACEMYSVPQEIVYAVIKSESDFKPDCVSQKGAIGLMQLTPDTFTWLCSKSGDGDPSAERLYMPEVNIRYGTMFLSLLYTEYGVWDTCFAAYNAGRTRVSEWLNEPGNNENGKLVHIPFTETEKYVKKVSAAVEIYRGILHPET